MIKRLLLLSCLYRAIARLHIQTSNADSSSALRFLVLADWGKYSGNGYGNGNGQGNGNGNGAPNAKDLTAKTSYQTQVAKAMGTYASSSEPPCSFIAALGDNFYDNGVQSADDSRWEYVWKDVYHGAYSSLNMPWYSVFGNHDYGYGASGVQAQIDRSESHYDDDLWNMPSTNYSKVFAIGDTGETVHIVFIDTTTLAPSVNRCCNEEGGVSSSEQYSRIKNQLENIAKMLDEAHQQNPTWLLVAGHYPMYSGGEHGDTSELITYLLPLLKAYSVHAYFCGHDHISEHLELDGIEYFVVGAGSMADSMSVKSAANLKWYGEGYSAFATVLATPSSLEVVYINTNNKEVYSYALTNPLAHTSSTGHKDGSSTSGTGGDNMTGYSIEKFSTLAFLIFIILLLLCGFCLFFCMYRSKQESGGSNTTTATLPAEYGPLQSNSRAVTSPTEDRRRLIPSKEPLVPYSPNRHLDSHARLLPTSPMERRFHTIV